jgi:hypothetical protein
MALENTNESRNEEEKIGGLLLLLALFLFYTAANNFIHINESIKQYTSKPIWDALTTPGSGAYHPMWGLLTIYGIVFRSLMICFPVVLWILLFRKHAKFPSLFIAFMIFFAVSELFFYISFRVVDPSMAKQILPNLIKIVSFTILCIAYIENSTRVKKTFYNEKISTPNEHIIM